MFHLEAHACIYRLLVEGIFDPDYTYFLAPKGKKVNLIVTFSYVSLFFPENYRVIDSNIVSYSMECITFIQNTMHMD